uniref:Uncharacterized protein n=1 Tax=Catagonus wagneri TaxID=51154 RepID=A0A8C3YPR6_9CETA
MMKLWISSSNLPSTTNPNRPILSHTLYIRHNYRLLISNPYLPRHKLRMNNPLLTCKRNIHILHLPFHPRRPRTVLRILFIPRDMKHRSYSPTNSNSNCLYRICTTMRANIFLRGNSHYKPFISNPIYWHRPSRMNLRGVLSR